VSAASQERLDTGEVRLAAEGRWFSDVLPAHGFDRELLDGRHHPCPRCGGISMFHALDHESGAVTCDQCFTDETTDGFAALMWLNGWTLKVARHAVSEVVGVRPRARGAGARGADAGTAAAETSEESWTALNTDKGRTDRANSRRLLETYSDRIRFCAAWDKWLVWDGVRWKLDEDGAVMRFAMATGDRLWQAAKSQLWNPSVVRFAVKSNNLASLSAMVKLAAPDVPVAVSELDANPKLLNCLNGTVDLRTGELRQHKQEDNLTKLCPTNYSPEASSYNWDRFLESLFDDSEIIAYLQRFFGYCLTGQVSEQILSVLWGSGSNGKSTLLNAIQATLGGDYTCAAPPALLMQKHNETHPTELASLFGKRLVIAQETDQGAKLAESTVKQLTGSDAISARRMREDFWTFQPSHKLLMATNHKPRIRGNDHAIWRRVVLIPFEKRFWNPAKGESGPPELEQQKQLPALLEAEKEGILAWMVRGCVEFSRVGLQIPESIQAATSDYRREEDCIGRFIEQRCLVGGMYKCKFSDLYESFEKWCNESGDNLPSRKGFGQALKECGYEDKHSGVRWYLGIGLRIDGDGFD